MIHPPKILTHDLHAKTYLYGSEKRLPDIYTQTSYGLYYATPIPNHAKLWYLRSHVLADLGIQITCFSYHNYFISENHKHTQDYYIDILEIEKHPQQWLLRDLYLDICVWEGRRLELLDTDEYLAAIAAGYLTQTQSTWALTQMHRMANGISECGNSLVAFLSQQGYSLRWSPEPSGA